MTSISLRDNGSALIRRSIRGGFLGRFSKELYLNIGRPRPLKELRVCQYARASGVATPEVVAAVVEKAPPIFYRGAVVTKEISPGADLQEEALAYEPKDRESIIEKRLCIDLLGKLIARMHGAGIYHADLHLKNILKSGARLYVLDLDAARIHEPLSNFKKRMNLLRLYRSAQKINRRKPAISRTDILRFLRSYTQGHRKLERNLSRMLPLWRLKWGLSDLLRI